MAERKRRSRARRHAAEAHVSPDAVVQEAAVPEESPVEPVPESAEPDVSPVDDVPEPAVHQESPEQVVPVHRRDPVPPSVRAAAGVNPERFVPPVDTEASPDVPVPPADAGESPVESEPGAERGVSPVVAMRPADHHASPDDEARRPVADEVRPVEMVPRAGTAVSPVMPARPPVSRIASASRAPRAPRLARALHSREGSMVLSHRPGDSARDRGIWAWQVAEGPCPVCRRERVRLVACHGQCLPGDLTYELALLDRDGVCVCALEALD